MKGLRKFRSKSLFWVVLWVPIFCTQTWKTAANDAPREYFDIALTDQADTSEPQQPLSGPNRKDTVPSDLRRLVRNDTTIQRTDTFSLKLSRDTLDAPVQYEAKDSAVVLVQEKMIILYGNTKTLYKDIELTAPQTELNQSTQILTAFGRKDSNNVVLERAQFKQAEEFFQSDTIRYNFKTQKGLTKNTFTQSGEFFIQAENSKRIGQVVYAQNGVMTTCNLDHPHFGFHYNKIKVVNNKVAVTGPIHPEFEGVPVPIYLPFGFFPLNRGRRSGFMAPTFTVNEDFGLGLENIGYYKVLSEYFDILFQTTIYSYGGWNGSIRSTYRKRYKYQGGMNFSVNNTKFNFKGDPDYSKTRTYNVTWSHSADVKARPGTTFSANVNAGSTRYNELLPNAPNRNFQNLLGSTIAYSKTWIGKPFNLTLAANHSQNNQLRLIQLNLPDAGFSVNTIYPFQRKEIVGSPKWYEKFGIGYRGNFQNRIAFYDTAFRFKQLIDTLQWGAQNSFPMSVALPPILGGNLIVSPQFSYENKFIAQKLFRTWNPVKEKVDSSVTKGFYTDHRVSFGLGLNTAIFGTKYFRKGSIRAIRHVIRPSFSVGYTPSLSKNNFTMLQIDTGGRKIPVSVFDGSLYGSYSNQDYGGMSFTFDNNLEMKVRGKKDSTERKVRLLDGFGFSTAYNFLKDSMKLEPFSLYLRSTLFEKINITGTGTLNPYDVDSSGYSINKWYWKRGGFRPGRITDAQVSVGANFQSKPKDAKKEEERKQLENQLLSDPLLASDYQSQMEYIRRNPGDFVDFNIPWTLNVGLSLRYSQLTTQDYEVVNDFSANLMFGGGFNLTPKWNFSVNGYYDFDTRNLQTFTLGITRDMHCWQMAISVTPVGLYRFFNITINPKSSMLRDLRINRTRYFYSY